MKYLKLTIICSCLFITLLGIFHIAEAAALGGGSGTIETIDQWKSDGTNITQRTASKPIKITGLLPSSVLCTDLNNILTTTGCPSGSGGGSGGGTFSTTTSTVSGRFINYPNNTTDIVNIGSNSTTTGKFYFDPNISLASFLGNFNFQYGSSTIYTSFKTASSTNYVGGGLATCSGSDFLQYSSNFFNCGTPSGSSSYSTSTASYVIYKSGSTVYGVNGFTGATISSNADIGVVLRALFAYATTTATVPGGTIMIREGAYSSNATSTFYGTVSSASTPGIVIRGAGIGATVITQTAGDFLNFRNFATAEVSNMSIYLSGDNTDGLTASSTTSSQRSLWDSSFHDLKIYADSGTHKGYAFYLANAFRNRYDNIEIFQTGNCVKEYALGSAFNIGDSVYTRIFCELSNPTAGAGIGYNFNGFSSAGGYYNQSTFLDVNGYDNNQNGIFMQLTNANWNNFKGMNAEQFATTTQLFGSQNNTFEYEYNIASPTGNYFGTDSTSYSNTIGAKNTDLPTGAHRVWLDLNTSRDRANIFQGVSGATARITGSGTYTFSTTTASIVRDVWDDATGSGAAQLQHEIMNAGDKLYLNWATAADSYIRYFGSRMSFFTGGSERISLTSGGLVGVGTTTPSYLLNPFSATAPQFALSAGAGVAQFTFRNAGGDFFLSTTTVAGNATTSTAALTVSGSGFGTTTVRGLNIIGQATSTSNVGFNITTGCYAINSTCITGGTSYPWKGAWSSLTSYVVNDLVQYQGSSYVSIQNGTNQVPAIGDTAYWSLMTQGTTAVINSGTINNLSYYSGATTLDSVNFVSANILAGMLGVGTTTPTSLLTLSTTTAPQISLSAGAGISQWIMRNAGGNLYFATTTLAGTATTSTSALTINGTTGAISIATSTAGCLNTNTAGLLYSATCATVTGLTSYNAWTNSLSAGNNVSATTSTLSFGYSSSTIYSSFFNASSTFLTTGTLTIPSLGVPAGSFLAVDTTGKVIATTTPSGGAGTASDYVSPLTNTEISITAEATTTISKQHVISGTSADYTVHLPICAGTNTGKFVSVRIASTTGASKIYTLDAYNAETIDAALTRPMWAGEAATVYCDGGNWEKVSGKTIPMKVRLTRSLTDQTGIANNTGTNINLDTQDTTIVGPAAMWDSGNNRAKILRAGAYQVGIFMYASNALTYGYISFAVNGSGVLDYTGLAAVSGVVAGSFNELVNVSINDYLQPRYYGNSAGTITVLGSAAPATIYLVEVPNW